MNANTLFLDLDALFVVMMTILIIIAIYLSVKLQIEKRASEKTKIQSRLDDLEKKVKKLLTKNTYKVILKNGTITELKDVCGVSDDYRYIDCFTMVKAEDRFFYNKYGEVIAKFKIDDVEHYYEVKE